MGGQSTVDLNADGTIDTTDVVHMRNWVISDNTITAVNTDEAPLSLTSAGSLDDAILGGEISANSIRYDPVGSATHFAINIKYATSTQVAMNSVEIDGNGDANYDEGIRITNSSNTAITNNTVRTTGSNTSGIRVQVNAGGTISGNLVVDESSNGLYGIDLYDCDEVTVGANTVDGWSRGISAQYNSTELSVSRNVCHDVGSCVRFDSSSNPTLDSVVSANEAHTCSSWCWRDETTGERNVWRDNIAFDGYVASGAIGS